MAAVRRYPGKAPTSSRVSTSFTYTRVKEIPSLNLPALHRVHSAGSASVSSTDSCTPSEREARRQIPLEEPYFITKMASYALKKAYWINAARGDKPEKAALATLTAMLDVVKAQNLAYDEREGQYFRYFDLLATPFSDAKYEMIVLYPNHFLPGGQTLLIGTQDPNDASQVLWKDYVASEDGALREDPGATSARLPAFCSYPRATRCNLNPLLVVLHAEMAFRRFKKSEHAPLCSDYQELVDLTIELADQIYYAPVVEAAVKASSGARELAVLRAQALERNKSKNEDVDKGKGKVDIKSDVNQDTATARRRQSQGTRGPRATTKYSRFGRVVKEPAEDAPREDVLDYCRYLISGRDEPLTRRDQAVIASTGLYTDERDVDDEEDWSSEGDEDEDEDDEDEY